MQDEYWIIFDRPRFKYFPWIWRVRHHFGKECTREYAWEMYNRASAECNSRQFVFLGVTAFGGIQILA